MNNIVKQLNDKMCMYCADKAEAYGKQGDYKKAFIWLERSIKFASPAERSYLMALTRLLEHNYSIILRTELKTK